MLDVHLSICPPFILIIPNYRPLISDIHLFGLYNLNIILSIYLYIYGRPSDLLRPSDLSLFPFPSKISIFLHSHSCRMISLIDFPTLPLSIRNRYFGHQTIWYLHCHTACDNFLNCFTEYLLLIFRVTTTPILGRYSFYVKLSDLTA